MRFCHLFVFVLLHFTRGLLQRNVKYVQSKLDGLSCTEHESVFMHHNMSYLQCTALCCKVSSCIGLSYIRDIGRCIGCGSATKSTFEVGSRFFIKISSDLRSDVPVTTAEPSECTGIAEGYGVPGSCPKKMLNISNGGTEGIWVSPLFCDSGSYAIGYTLKIESNQFLRDDSAVNALGLQCSSADHFHQGDLIVPGEADFGEWYAPGMCPNKGDVLKAFQMQVDTNDDTVTTDSTGVNFVRFQCGPLNSSLEISEANSLDLPHGKGLWGTFGNWSEQCDVGQGICGLRQKIDFRPEAFDTDRTGLTNVILYCC